MKTLTTLDPMRAAIPEARRAPLFADTKAQYGLYAISCGFFLVLLDTTALNVAVPAMEREFGGTISALQWVVNGYTVAFASLLLACGAVGDRYGARRLYQCGLIVFAGMSLLCALSPNVEFLIGMRMIQGLAAAMMLPASLSLLSHAFPRADERARAIAFWASIVSLAFAAGPALGGILTNYFGWRSIFLINVPVAAIALLMIRRFVSEAKVANPRRIDWVGQSAVSLSLFALTYGLIEAGRAGWTSPRILLAFAAAIVLAAIFALRERSSDTPVLPRSLFSDPAFATCIAVAVVLNFGMYGTLFIESIYLQNVRHLSALAVGVMILPFTVTPGITTRLIDRFDPGMHFKSRLVIGHAIAVVGAAVMGLALWTSGYWAVLTGLAMLGVAMGYVMPAMTVGVLTASPASTSGLASGILNSARQVGGTIGVALTGTLVQRRHEQGLLWSFVVMLLCYLIMGGITVRSIPSRAST